MKLTTPTLDGVDMLARHAIIHKRIDAGEAHGALAFQTPEGYRVAEVEEQHDRQGDLAGGEHVAEHFCSGDARKERVCGRVEEREGVG